MTDWNDNSDQMKCILYELGNVKKAQTELIRLAKEMQAHAEQAVRQRTVLEISISLLNDPDWIEKGRALRIKHNVDSA